MNRPWGFWALWLSVALVANAEKPRWYEHPGFWFKSVLASPSEGSRAPRLNAVDEAGVPFNARNLKEEYLLVSFWASWCPPCRAEMPVLAAIAADNPHVKVLAVNVRDDSTAARRFAENLEVKPFFLFDDAGKTARDYAISSIPVNFLLKAETFEVLERWTGTVNTGDLERRIGSSREK